MLKRIKLQNSIILLTAIVFVFLGIYLLSYEYLLSKKDKVFSEMNVLLYENEQPLYFESEDQAIDESDNADLPIENLDNQDIPQAESNNYTGILEIPKIGLKRGFYNIGNKYNNVDYNITVINGSTFPGTPNNNLILAAHSGNCSMCYFDTLYKLSLGDKAILNYKNKTYTYKITKIYEVEKTGSVVIHRNYNMETLTLVTCTRNSDTKQTVYILELVNK